MSQEFFDPRAELDYSDFQEVGEFETVKHVPKGIDADVPGPWPRQSPMPPSERAQFEQARQKLDRALQVCRVCPSMPQEGQTPAMYEASLLKELARHAGGRIARTDFSPQYSPENVIASCETYDVVGKALAEPARLGKLAEIVTTDATGREIREFVGAKSTWMNPLKSPLQYSPLYIDDQPQRV